MKFKKIFLLFQLLSAVLLVTSFIIYFLKAKIFLDPDFGWALRMGEVILKSGIPKSDPFSYTMPSYPYVDYEWLTHIGIAKIYSLANFTGLTLIFTFIALVSIVVCVWDLNKRFTPLGIIFATAMFFSYFGVRSQVITWLFFAILVKIILSDKWWRKFKYFLPVLFLLWANLHAGFVAGLIVLSVAIFRKRNFGDFVLLFLSILITLLNPYGIGLWREVWVSTTDLPIRFFIIEWRPLLFSITSITLISIAYFLAFIVQYWKRYKGYEILIFILIFIAAFSSARNVPLLLIYSIILTRKGIENFMLEVGDNRQKLFRFHLVYVFFFIVILVLAFFQIKGDYLAAATRSEKRYYPEKALIYLSSHMPKGQVYSNYEWGGYLDWKFPQKKVFIDGRMASWRQKLSVLESDYIFGENNSLLRLKIPLNRVFKKYQIDTVLLPQSWLAGDKNDTTSQIISRFVKELKKNEFIEVYNDNVAIVYSRKRPSTTEDNLVGE